MFSTLLRCPLSEYALKKYLFQYLTGNRNYVATKDDDQKNVSDTIECHNSR